MNEVLIVSAPGGEAARDLWILLRAAGLDARLTDDAVAVATEFDAAVVPVVLPGGSVRDLPAEAHRVRSLTRRGTAALAAALRERCGPAAEVLRHELRLAVRIADGRLHTTATLAGVALGARDAPLPFGRDEVWGLIDLADADARLARLGARLSAAMLDPDALEAITTLVGAAVDGTVIDVVVEGDGPAHELPYELLRLADQRVLATAEGVRLIRAVTGVAAPGHSPAPGPLKILVAVGAPERTDNPQLDVEAEMQAIVAVLGEARAEVTILEVASPQEIAAALRRDAYHVLHLSAHGWPYGVELEDAAGNAVAVSAEDLVRALRRGGRPLPLIVLSSCGGAADADSGLAVTLLRHGADRVLAMQTTVSDGYATRLLTGVYRALAEPGTPVAAAVARSRAALFDDADEPGRPEYAIPALFAASDGPLWDPAAAPAPLSNPTELPTGDGVREMLIGDLVGRRGLLRTVTRTLRDEDTGAPLTGGVALLGPAGIGKSAIAGRVVTRLRDDVDDPWEIVVHTGAWNPRVLAALPDPADALRNRRVLLVFDDFEQNLTIGGAAFADPGFGETFAALCAAAERGKILVTSRHPVPAAVALARVDVPPLGDAELRRLLLRQPALRELSTEDRDAVVAAVGGHPRLVEFVDALLHGGARRPDVTARLRALAAKTTAPAEATRERTARAASEREQTAAADATREAIALGARDVLLAELLALLGEDARETLLQAAVWRSPVGRDDLAFAVHGREPSEVDAKAIAGHLDRLRDLTLVANVDNAALVEPWLREALAGQHGDRLPHRHRRAAAACRHAIEQERATFATFVEAVHHLREAGLVDELAAFAEEGLPRLGGEQTVAAFLGDVTPGLPERHPVYPMLLGRERNALEAIGNTAAAAAKGEELLALAERAAADAPADAEAQVSLSAALDAQGRLARRLGRAADARRHYTRALAVDCGLADADPQDIRWQRNVATSRHRLAELALDDTDLPAARQAADESLAIRRRLAADEPALRWDLAEALALRAAVHRQAGADTEARPPLEEALGLWRALAAEDPEDLDLVVGLHDCLGALADCADLDADARRELVIEAAGLAERLAAADPADIGHQRRAMTGNWRLGDMDLAAGDPACAAGHFATALGQAQRLADSDPRSVAPQRDLATALRHMADHALAAGRPEEVRGHLERAEEITEAAVHRFPRHAALHRDLAESRERLGAWLATTGDPSAARALLRQSLNSWRRASTLDPDETGDRIGQAAVHARLAELDEAAGHEGRARRHWLEALDLAELANAEAPTPRHAAAVETYEMRSQASAAHPG